jgi:hypothetical protein
MINRALAGQPALLTFTKDFREFLRGDLAPDHAVDIDFDAERLPQVIDSPNGFIECHVVFKNGGTPQVYRLDSPGGLLTRKAGDEPGGGSMVGTRFTIPSDAEQIEMWFSAIVGSAAVAFDSDFGKNFAFPFVERDIRVVAADVAATLDAAADRFSAAVETSPGVGELLLDYRVTNMQPVAPTTTRIALQLGGSALDGWQTWSTPAIAVPHGAVVAFSVTYRRGGHVYFDDNHHRGYLAPVPPPPQAAMAK